MREVSCKLVIIHYFFGRKAQSAEHIKFLIAFLFLEATWVVSLDDHVSCVATAIFWKRERVS